MSSISTTVKGDSECRHCFSRSEEHTSELQSHHDLVCRLLLEKKKKKKKKIKKKKKKIKNNTTKNKKRTERIQKKKAKTKHQSHNRTDQSHITATNKSEIEEQ